MSKSNTIEYLDGLCGSGKTHVMLEQIAKNKDKQSTIYIIETIALGEEIAHSAKKLGINVKFFHSNNSKGIRKDIGNFVYNMKNLKKHFLLLITRASFERIDNCFLVNNTASYHLVKDEVFDVINTYTISDIHEQELLNYYLTIKETTKSNLVTLKIGVFNFREIETIINDKELTSNFQEILKACYKGDVVFVSREQWASIKQGDCEGLSIMSFTNPKKYLGWKSQTFLGANFTSSFLYKIWTRFFNIDFKPCKLKKSLRFQEHKLDCDIKIHYLLDDSLWTKKLANNSQDDAIFIESVVKYIKAFIDINLPESKVLSVFNRAHNHLKPINWNQAPVKSQGLNCYQDNDIFVSTVALNYAPNFIKMLLKLDISSNDITEAMVKETLYQGLMRIKLRNPVNTSSITIFVMIEEFAIFLKTLFKNATISKL